jgi:hypothetical protein
MVAPDFSRFWLPTTDASEPAFRDERRDEEAHRQQRALEELNERVNLARSIV